jgi:hypothetical protein
MDLTALSGSEGIIDMQKNEILNKHLNPGIDTIQ